MSGSDPPRRQYGLRDRLAIAILVWAARLICMVISRDSEVKINYTVTRVKS